jgi:hypothetical protein
VEHFGVKDHTKALTKNGYEDDRDQEWQDDVDELAPEECRKFRMLAARINYMAQNNPMLQFPAKEGCRNMAKQKVVDFATAKRTVRFLRCGGGCLQVRLAGRGGVQVHPDLRGQ